jgi:hypothetical protein
MEWQAFLSDPEIDTSLGYQPPAKHLFGKMVHDVLESINAILGGSRMGDELDLTNQLPEPARTWFLHNAPILLQERAHIYTLSADFLNQTETLAGWLGLVDEIGKSALHVATLNDDLDKLPQSPTEVARGAVDIIKRNLMKLALIGRDIQNDEYKRLWTLDYRELVQTL